MTSFPFAIVGFDLDGTLLDTSADLAAAVNHVLDGVGCPRLSVAQVTAHIGGGGRRMLARSLAEAGHDQSGLDVLYDRMLAFYAAHIADETRAFPGCLAALDDLAARGARIAIVTNKSEHLARELLDALGLSSRFACLIGGDTLGPGNAKPSPAPIHDMIARCGGGRAAFVGDSIYDITAGRAAGVPTVAVSFGFLDRPVADLGADAVIDTYADLVPTLERLG
ncbi:HAD-IA family hydrolase [Hephaestia sp. GCM10023244]|uniref:HAD-IA family hydrolase n=1 Tax=unclassified Hephaestia TaxID=2631281 RepID=UPI002076E2FA|nr:HAD-IA family hydrolase [Hephaestia sp. MAHUQ-44]MCM8730288.1 HAD-IA family hydrolase [Hephaestia sp. MAHUQ-44]